MVALGFAVIWVGYQQLIYGYCLLKGFDVRWRDLANPIHPYQWPVPPARPAQIPPGQVMPSGTSTAASTTAAAAPVTTT